MEAGCTVMDLDELIPSDWRALLAGYLQSLDWKKLKAKLQAEIASNQNAVCPPPALFFKALELTPVDQVSVVILGQDPYHSPGLAQGLAFSIPEHIPSGSRAFPSSLRNISKALELEGFGTLANGDLHHWATQGVLLLNTALSVGLGEAGSHFKLGWQHCVDALINQLSISKPDIVWLLWGAHAQSKVPLIEGTAHRQSALAPLVLQSSHPSGLGVFKTDRPFLIRGNVGEGAKASCGHFTQTNQWLNRQGKRPIQWVKSSDMPRQSTLFTDDCH